MAYVITLKKLNVFEVTFADGTKSEFHQVDEEWNGLRELRDQNGLKMIAMRKDMPNALNELFGGLFRMDDHEWFLIAASPDLFARMKPKAGR